MLPARRSDNPPVGWSFPWNTTEASESFPTKSGRAASSRVLSGTTSAGSPVAPSRFETTFAAAAQAQGIKVPYAGFTGSVAQALRPYPQYGDINGDSSFHGDMVSLDADGATTGLLSDGELLLLDTGNPRSLPAYEEQRGHGSPKKSRG